jgi:predicted DNA-binding protein YlxM (UPF0122 family)
VKNGLHSGENHRVHYTRKILKDHLIELMRTHPVTEISVKEICALAEVSRSTFYAHYEDVYHLLAEIEEEVFVYFEDMVNRIPVKCGNREFEAIFQKMLQYVALNSNSLQILLSENGDAGFQKKFFRRFIAHGQKIIKSVLENPKDTYINEGYSVFVVNGSVGLLQYWLKNGMHIPIPALAKMLVKMTQPARADID